MANTNPKIMVKIPDFLDIVTGKKSIELNLFYTFEMKIERTFVFVGPIIYVSDTAFFLPNFSKDVFGEGNMFNHYKLKWGETTQPMGNVNFSKRFAKMSPNVNQKYGVYKY